MGIGLRYLQRRISCKKELAESYLRTHLGVCFDTSHVAVQFEDPSESLLAYDAAGIRISKIQLSAALEVFNERSCIEALHPFVEPVYLHQVKAMTRHGAIRSWNDLPDALNQVKDQREFDRLRIHFHVPLFWEGSSLLGTTASGLNGSFFEAVRKTSCSHLEIETYTYEVLPEHLRPPDIVSSISNEFSWVLQRMSAPTQPASS